MECNKDCGVTTVTVPLAHLEGKDIRYSQMVKRFVIALIVALFLMFAEAGIFVWLWNQYDYTSVETSVEAANENEGTIGNVNIAAGPNAAAGE